MQQEPDEYTKGLVEAVVHQRERASNEAAEATAHVAVLKKEVAMLKERIAELEGKPDAEPEDDEVPV